MRYDITILMLLYTLNTTLPYVTHSRTLLQRLLLRYYNAYCYVTTTLTVTLLYNAKETSTNISKFSIINPSQFRNFFVRMNFSNFDLEKNV